MKTLLSEKTQIKINEWLLRYPPDQKRSAVLQALHFVQEDNQGSLTVPLMDAVAEFLSVPKTAVYEVATFYSMYHLEPVGRHVINVCTSISCTLSGCDKIVDHLKNRLGVEVGETTADGKFTLKTAECLAACIAAPVLYIGKKYYEHLTPEKVDKILEELKA